MITNKMDTIPRLRFTNEPVKRQPVFEHTAADGKVHRVMIVPVDHRFARICSASPALQEEPLSDKYTMVGDEGGSARKVKGNFIVAWFDSYTLMYDGEPILRLECERQQAMIGQGGCRLIGHAI
jgi:hypothetical protein